MRNITITFCIAALLMILSGSALAAEPDFGGAWALDKTKSEGLPPGMDQTLTVAQSGDKLSLETKVTTEKGEQTITDTYMLDGKETDFSPNAGTLAGKGKRTAKRTADGLEAQETVLFDTPNGEVTVKISRKWTLSSDGKSLTVEVASENPNGTQKTKRVFNKK